MKPIKNILSQLGGKPQEKYICALGTKNAETFAEKSGVSSTFAVLSDKHLYMRGSFYTKTANTYHAAKGDGLQNMKEYKHARIVHTHWLWLLLAALAAVVFTCWAAVTVFNAWVRFESSGGQWILFFASLAGTLLMFLVYNRTKRSWIEMIFAAQTYVFNITGIDQLEVQNFQRSMRMINDGRQVDL